MDPGAYPRQTLPPQPTARPTPPLAEGLYLATEHDVHRGVGFDAYPLLRPLRDKIRAENLLWRALQHAGVRTRWEAPLRAIAALAGRDRSVWTVWVDHRSGALSWELRILNAEEHRDGHPLGVLGPVRELLAPWVDLPAPRSLPDYAVLALHFDAASAARETMRVQIHRQGPSPRVMEVFAVDADGPTPAGRDVALHPKRDIDEVLARIKDSAVVDYSLDRRLLGRTLIPELFACRRIHVGRREHCDALGFAGVAVDQLRFVHQRFEYPEPLRAWLAEHRDRLEHILFDVVTEYCARDGRIVHLRTGFGSCL